MIKTVQLFPGITLRIFPDQRFKQNALSIQFIRPMCREEASLNALLPAVLLRGCRQAPDLRTITQKLDDLYGASISTQVRRIGDYQTTGLYCSFVSDRFTLSSDAVLAPLVEFLGRLLLDPVLENGVFSADFVESEKKNLISTIAAQLNDKRGYCASRLLEEMCREDSFGIPRLGKIQWVQTITPQALYTHYQKVLGESRVDLCYVGQGDPEEIEKLLKNLFAGVQRQYLALPAQTAFSAAGGGEYRETMEIAQGKLAMGFTTPVTLRSDDYAAMQVCNLVFGGGQTSKLFMNVREKMSLCYDIGSSYHGSKGIITVNAGIAWDQEAVVRAEVLRQLEAVQQGAFTSEELNAAKQALIAGLRGIHDSAGSIENYYATAALSGFGLAPAAYIQKVEQVDAAAVVAMAKTLQPHTVYFLRGEQ